MTRRGHLLLISPVFHGYWRSIAGAFERRGYDVTTHIYDARSTFATIRHKAVRELPARWGIQRRDDRRPTLAAVAAMRASQPDAVLAIRVDRMGDAFWAELATIPRSVLWLYDEVRRTTHTDETLGAASAVASYSRLDVAAFRAKGLHAAHVANAFDPSTPVTRRPPTGDVTFVGARYPNRETLLRDLQHEGIAVRAYGRDWSDHPIDRLRTWRATSVGIPNERDVPRAEAYAVMRASAATLNMHFDQDGFTMRTFEAAGVGAVQLIDRPDVAEFYEPGREIAVFSSATEAAELARRAQRDTAWSNSIREGGRKRTLAEHTFDHRVAELEQLWQ